jgi:hypothetical protein
VGQRRNMVRGDRADTLEVFRDKRARRQSR